MTSRDDDHGLAPNVENVLHDLGFVRDQVIDEYEYTFETPIKLYQWFNAERRQALNEFVQFTEYHDHVLHIYKSVRISGDPQDPNNNLAWANWKQ